MNVKNFICALAVFAIISLFSCTKEQIPDFKEVTFSVEVNAVGEDFAKLTIVHDGSNRDRYCGFLVNGKPSDYLAEINNFIIENTELLLYENAMSQRKKVVKIDNLLPGTDYSYIVFGITEDGNVSGIPSCVSFRTSKIAIDYVENPNWTFNIKGEVFHNKAYWTRIDLKIDNIYSERCLVWIVPQEKVAGVDDDASIVNTAFSLYKKERGMKDQNMWADNNWVIGESTSFFFQKQPGNYLVVAIGINRDGSLTGHYAMTEMFHIAEYTPNANYTQYYGEWSLTDAQKVSYDVVIEKKVVNWELLMTGICGGNYPFTLDVEEETGIVTLSWQTVNHGLTYRLSDGTEIYAYANLCGWYSSGDDSKKRTTSKKLATGNIRGDGTFVLNSAFTADDGYPIKGLYIMICVDGNQIGNLKGSILQFPIELKRK